MPLSSFEYKNNTWYLPEAGELVIPENKKPYIALRCTAKGEKPEYEYIHLSESLSIGLRQEVEKRVLEGYTFRDFCMKGDVSFVSKGVLGYESITSLEMQLRCRVATVKSATFIQGKGVEIEETVLLSMERPILYFTKEEVYYYRHGNILTVGTPSEFIGAAKLSLHEEKDFIFAKRFVWQRRPAHDKMAGQVLSAIIAICGIVENVKQPTKILL